MLNELEETTVQLNVLMANTWKLYVQAWNAESMNERSRLLEKACAKDSQYIDPNVELEGHEALTAYMAEFHQQMPRTRFEVTRFFCHHHKSIACWDLIDDKGAILFSGISYGTYNTKGNLTAEHGFFNPPAGNEAE